MKKVAVNEPIPALSFLATDLKLTTFSALQGSNVILYFYPKDNTPGCTLEGQDFKAFYAKFAKLKTKIVGISRDSLLSHEKFIAKFELPFPLIADTEEVLCKLFNVMVEKNLYGKKSIGIERSTFLIDKKGILRQEWRKVSVKGHVEEVLKAVKGLET